jgi:hypothetical protein
MESGLGQADDRTDVLAALKLSVETGHAFDIEARRRHADGVYRWFLRADLHCAIMRLGASPSKNGTREDRISHARIC